MAMKQPVTLVDTLREGWMQFRKSDPAKKSSWKKYWFVLGRSTLRYYQRERDMTPKGELQLEGALVIDLDVSNPVQLPPSVRRDCVLQLWKGRELPHLLAAPCPDDKYRWIRALQNAVENMDISTASGSGSAPQAVPSSHSVPIAQTPVGSVAQSSYLSASPLGTSPPQASGSPPPGPASDSGDVGGGSEEVALEGQKAYSVSGEQLVLTYRYMKERVEAQGVPRVVFLPAGKVYRRFGLRLVVGKLLKKFPSLDTLCFEDCLFAADFFEEFAEALGHLPGVRTVIFRADGGKSASLQDELPRVLGWLPSTVKSVAFENVLTKRGVLAFLDALSSPVARAPNPTLASQLSGVSLVGHPLRAGPLDRLIALTSCLATLNLSQSSLGDDGVASLLEVLAESAFLHTLVLVDNRVTRASADALVHFLSTNHSLTVLDLSYNRLQDGADDVFLVLAGFHQRLKELNLAGNRIGHGSVFALLKLVQQNTSLLTLNLERNRFREESGHMLAAVFGQNVSLTSFRIGHPGPSSSFSSSSSSASAASAAAAASSSSNASSSSSAILPVHLQLFQRVCYRNEEALKKLRTADRAPEQRSWAERKAGHEQLLQRLRHLLGLGEAAWQDMRESAEFERCTAFVALLLDRGYSDHLVDEFVNDGEFRDIIGLNGAFIRQASLLFSLSEQLLAQLRSLDEISSSSRNVQPSEDISNQMPSGESAQQGNVSNRSSFKEGNASVRSSFKEGYMFKRGGRRHNWKRRWFVLEDTMMHYYLAHDNRKRKGTIPLDQAVVREGTRGITAYTFEVVTANRTYVLSCDTQGEQEAWICALAEARDDGGGREHLAAVHVDELIGAVSTLAKTYDAHRLHMDDPHRKWAFQYWLQVLLETLSLYVLSRSAEQYRPSLQLIRANLHQSTAVLLYLLTGEYLYDYGLLRVLDAATCADLEVRALLNDWLESVLADLAGLASFQDGLDELVQHLLDESFAIPEVVLDDEGARAARAPFPALLEKSAMWAPDAASSFVYRVLAELPDGVLADLLGLEKKLLKRATSSSAASLSRADAALAAAAASGMVYTFHRLAGAPPIKNPPAPRMTSPEFMRNSAQVRARLADLDNGSVYAAEFRDMSKQYVAGGGSMADKSIDSVVFCLCAVPALQHLREPTVRLLSYVQWLSMRWPVDVIAGGVQLTPAARAHSLRLVCSLQALFRALADAPVAVDAVRAYERWRSFVRNGQDLVQLLALSAHHAFPRSSHDCVQAPLQLLFSSAISALVSLVSAEVTSGGAFVVY